MIPEISVALVIQGPLVTTELVRMFRSMGATKCWLRGDSKQGTALAYAHNGCRFNRDPEDSYYVEDVAFPYLKQLIAKGELFQVIRENNLTPSLSIGVYASDVIPSISLDAHQIQLLAEHSISLDIDVILVGAETQSP